MRGVLIHPYQITDPLANQVVTIIITLAANDAPLAERPLLLSVGVAKQLPVVKTGVFANLVPLIEEAWTALGVRVQVAGAAMPPFVFVGSETAYKIFAVKKLPSGEDDRLYDAPCPNVYVTGGICQGNTSFPDCSPQTILAALKLFMEDSLFNADLSRGKCRSYPNDVRQLWVELDGHRRFPLSELIPAQISLQSLLS